MERLLLEINDEIEHKCKRIGEVVEEKHKLMIAESYKCMAKCFDIDIGMEESNKCARICKKPLREAHSKIQFQIDESQHFIKGCIEDCVDMHGEIPTRKVRKCFDVCKKESLMILKQAKRLSRLWIGK